MLVRILLLFMFVFLAACSSLHRDGPPDFPVDVSKIPDAVPKKEALSKYGNNVYEVNGHYYHILSSIKNFKQVGVASWYGRQFHSHRTSSGERYNMLAMTAAHKTLPLPTYVSVKNLQNGRKIIVKVNDRGPFAEGRILDLSYVAAKKLGMLGRGTAHVEIVAIDPTQIQVKKLPHSVPHQIYLARNQSNTHHPKIYLQMGAFHERLLAEQLQHKLNHLLSSPVMITRRSNNKTLYHVEIGPIHDVVTANRIRQKLRLAGLDKNVIQRKEG